MHECEDYFRGIFRTEGCKGISEQLEYVLTVVDGNMNFVLTIRVEMEVE